MGKGPKERECRVQEHLNEVGGTIGYLGGGQDFKSPSPLSSQDKTWFRELSVQPLAARQAAASEPPVLAPRWEQAYELTGSDSNFAPHFICALPVNTGERVGYP